MRSFFKSRKRATTALLAAVGAGVVLLMSLALLAPANAQFWGGWDSRQRQQQNNNNNNNNNFFNWGWGGDRYQQQPQQPQVDYSRAPSTTRSKDAPAPTMPIVVFGDSMADWLAYGLEDAYAEKPDIGIVRKHRTDSGLIRYGGRADVEWPQVIREAIAAEKPKFIVMMVGNNDRATIREKQPPAVRPGTPAAAKGQTPPAQQGAAQAPAKPAEPAPPQDAELQQDAAEPVAVPTTEQARQALYGPWEFHTEKWELAYIKRIDATIAAMKSAGVPVLWVGLPARSGAKATTDVSYLNELYKSRAEKAGIVYVDIWDGFVDEQGRYNSQGPDYEGQTRRLRTGDGAHFTRFGARKLAHYVEREIERSIAARAVPVALPPLDQGPEPKNAKPGMPAPRPSAGAVLPLTTSATTAEELLGGGRPAPAPVRPAATDGAAARVLTRGEAVTNAPTGRADDFAWPRGSAADEPATILPATAMTPAGLAKPGELPAPSTDPNADKKTAADDAPKRVAPKTVSRDEQQRQGGGWFGGWGGWGGGDRGGGDRGGGNRGGGWFGRW